MTLRNRWFLSLGAFLLLATSATAAEEFAPGTEVSRELVAHDGQRILFTVTPPEGRAVDPRIFDLFSVEDGAEKAANAPGLFRKGSDTEPVAGDAIDVSGYIVNVERVGAAANTCTLQVALAKFQKTKLTADHYYYVRAKGPADMIVAAYGITGDVDAAVFRGLETTGTLCSKSTKGFGQLDLAKCNQGSCNTSGDTLSGAIANFQTKDVEFVGAITITFVN